MEGGIVGAGVDVIALGRASVVVKHPDKVAQGFDELDVGVRRADNQTKYKENACLPLMNPQPTRIGYGGRGGSPPLVK